MNLEPFQVSAWYVQNTPLSNDNWLAVTFQVEITCHCWCQSLILLLHRRVQVLFDLENHLLSGPPTPHSSVGPGRDEDLIRPIMPLLKSRWAASRHAAGTEPTHCPLRGRFSVNQLSSGFVWGFFLSTLTLTPLYTCRGGGINHIRSQNNIQSDENGWNKRREGMWQEEEVWFFQEKYHGTEGGRRKRERERGIEKRDGDNEGGM